MPFVAILGAGPLGGALAHALASRSRFDAVRLIDPAKTLAAGKALDILQAGPVDGSSTRVTGHATLEAADGAWAILLADPVEPDPLTHLQQVHRRSPAAVIVCADATHQIPLARAVATGAVPPDRLVGSAPFAAASAARALLALAMDVSPAVIDVGVSGCDTGHAPCGIDWARTAIDGEPAETAVQRGVRARLDARVDASWPPGPLTLASAGARVAEAAWFGARHAFPCWWVTDGGHTPPGVHRLRFAAGGRARAVGTAGGVGAAPGSGR